jgi:hypothetical protein
MLVYRRMALREFADDAGRQWRVWDVRQENIHPATRGEDYMRDYLDGWLTFESMDGVAKCRLHPIPRKWDEADRDQLVKWLHAAETVRGDRVSGPQARTSAELVAKLSSGLERPRGSARTFRFPSGRYWSVAEWTTTSGATEAAPERTVLRFTSGMRSMDLGAWPENWHSLSDTQLAALLAKGFPRPDTRSNPTAFRRRAADQELR